MGPRAAPNPGPDEPALDHDGAAAAPNPGPDEPALDPPVAMKGSRFGPARHVPRHDGAASSAPPPHWFAGAPRRGTGYSDRGPPAPGWGHDAREQAARRGCG